MKWISLFPILILCLSYSAFADISREHFEQAAVQEILERFPYLSTRTDLYNHFIGELRIFILQECERTGMCPYLVESLIQVESKYNPKARSKGGALGLMQLMPKTAQKMGVKGNDWRDNVRGGICYMAQLLDQYSMNAAIAAYKVGPGRVRRYGGKMPPHRSTRNYVSRVLSISEKLKAQSIYEERGS
jgi:hypothetical protein